MAPSKMHDDEVPIDTALVRRLLAAQFPEWSARPLAEFTSTGTVNATYRLGDDLCVRLPRVERWSSLDNELRWLPVLAPQLPLAIPQPVAVGEPSEEYPFAWAIYRWLEGETFAIDRVDECEAATDLAHFVTAMRRVDRSGAPRSHRDKSLREKDPESRAAIEALHGLIDTDGATAAWETSLRAPAWDGTPVWTHGDLLPPNLLVADGRLRAVLDFGNAGAGDPAVDVIPAWTTFGADGRRTFRSVLDVDDATWIRARGAALHQALLIIPYYPKTNAALVTMATRTVAEVLADHDA